MFLTSIMAGAICAVAAALEGVFAGKQPLSTLRFLQQPRWSLLVAGWVLIGLFWYTICLVGLIRLLPGFGAHPVPLILLIVLMLANAAWNFVLFRAKRFDLAFAYFLPYTILLMILLWSLSRVDRLTALIFAAYGVYLPYAAAWTFRLWQLNKKPVSRG